MPIDNKQFNKLITEDLSGELDGEENLGKSLEEILVAEIERLEKNYGSEVDFVLIGRVKSTNEQSHCSTSMSENEKYELVYGI